MKPYKTIFAGLLLTITALSCNHKQDSKTFGGSNDTTSSNKAGGPVIRDTAAITADEKKGKSRFCRPRHNS